MNGNNTGQKENARDSQIQSAIDSVGATNSERQNKTEQNLRRWGTKASLQTTALLQRARADTRLVFFPTLRLAFVVAVHDQITCVACPSTKKQTRRRRRRRKEQQQQQEEERKEEEEEGEEEEEDRHRPYLSVKPKEKGKTYKRNNSKKNNKKRETQTKKERQQEEEEEEEAEEEQSEEEDEEEQEKEEEEEQQQQQQQPRQHRAHYLKHTVLTPHFTKKNNLTPHFLKKILGVRFPSILLFQASKHPRGTQPFFEPPWTQFWFPTPHNGQNRTPPPHTP